MLKLVIFILVILFILHNMNGQRIENFTPSQLKIT